MLLSLNNDFFRALTAQLFRRYSSRGSSSEDMKFSATCISTDQLVRTGHFYDIFSS
ncbi:hypothetical protein LguiB_001252 [Lonicera macranthoides]